jgi:tetratricopeptide (TPR) repeat protein
MIRLMGMTEPVPLGTLRPELPEDLATITRKALEKDKNMRYASAAAMADDVRRHLNDEPIEARPPSAIYQLKKFTRRNRAVVAGLTLTFGALLAGIVATSWQASRAKRAELVAVESEGLAREAEAAAKAEAAAAVEVNAFLHAMIGFDPMDPLGARYRGDTTLLEIVDRAERELDEKPLKDPRSEAKIRIAMGAIWGRLEDQERALKNRQRALDLRLQIHGPNHVKVAEARNTVAVACVNLGRVDEAEDHLRKALAIYEELDDPEQDRKEATTLGNLGSVLRMRGDLDGAEQLFVRAREMHERTLGPYSLHVSNAVSQLATIADERGDMERALELQRESVEIARTAGLIEHPHAVAKLSSLAAWLKREGRWQEAEPLFRESIAIREKLYPADHVDLAVARLNFAVFLKSTSRPEEAEPLLELAVPVLRQHPDRVADLGYALMALGECVSKHDPRLGLAHLREALGKFQAARASRTTVAVCRVSIARALLDAGDREAAEAAYGQALASFPSSHDKQSYQVDATFQVAKFAMDAGEPVESYEPLLRSVVELEPVVRHQARHNLDELLLAARVMLARIARDRGELEEAERLLSEGLTAGPEVAPDTLQVARRELVRALEDQSKHAAAESFLEEALEGASIATEEEQAARIELLARYGDAKMALGQYDRAEVVFSEALDETQRLFGDRSPEMAEVLASFGAALQRAGRHQGAINAFEDSFDITGEDPPADAHEAEHLISYGHALIDANRFGDAEAALLDCLGGVEGFASDEAPITQDVLALLTTLYETWGMPGSADEYRERLLASAGSE